MLATIIFLVSLAPTAAADEWTKTFDVSGPPSLRVETSDANIRVITWEKNSIEAKVITRSWGIGKGEVEIRDRQTGDTVEMEVKLPRSWFSFKIRSVDIEIRMPRRAILNLRTGDGRIEVRGTSGEMNLHTGDGRLDIEDVEGSLRAKTGDGTATVSGRFDVLEVETGDGRIEASALPGSRMSASWTLRTGDGSLALRLPDDFSADVDLHTGDGNIDLGVPVTISGSPRRNRIQGKIGDGGELLTMKTGDGSIRLGKL